jgi:ribose/xylose/arabinose/galactoside ABC-type transport system permease subunit
MMRRFLYGIFAQARRYRRAMDTTLDYLLAQHDFFGMTVQNWIVIVAFIFFFWLLARYVTPHN